ncbi:MAG TPA: hypothetical protein PLY87_22025, partial [Planctomycetaceae bacterium]|nr:hypothetical protein [Planctomycetaceae bacterium]
MPDNTDMPDFDFSEGMVPGGPADEANADPMDYFEGDDYPDDPDAIVPREIVPEGSIQEGVTAVKPKSRTPKIAAAAVAVAVAAGGGVYWGWPSEPDPVIPPVVTPVVVTPAVATPEIATPEIATTEVATPEVATAAPELMTTAALLDVPFPKLSIAERDELLKRAENGKLSRRLYAIFLEWTNAHKAEIDADPALRKRVDECLADLRNWFGEDQAGAQMMPITGFPVVNHNRFEGEKTPMPSVQLIRALLMFRTSIPTLTLLLPMFDEDNQDADRDAFEDASLPLLRRFTGARNSIANSLMKKDRNAALSVCDAAIKLARTEKHKAHLSLHSLSASKERGGRKTDEDLEVAHDNYFDQLPMQEDQFLKQKEEIQATERVPSRSPLTVNEFNVSIAALNLPVELSSLTNEADIDRLGEPQLTGKPTEEELKEFKATRRGVGLAVVAVKTILANKPDEEFLTTEDAANVTTQREIMRTGLSEMKLMRLMIANRPEPSETAKPGLTPAQVNATLAGLEIPDDVDSIPSPAQATPAQQTEFVDLRKSVKNWKEQILDALKDSTTNELLPLDMPLPGQVAEEVTTKIEQLRSGWFQLQARRLTPGGSGGTSYVYAEGDTVAAFQAALNGIGLPKDLSTLKLVHATEEQRAEFDELAKVIETARTSIQTELKDKPDEEKLSPEVATTLTENLGAIRDAHFDMKTRILISQLPPSEASEMAILVTSVTKPSEVRAVLTGLGLPEVLDTLQLAQSASEPQRAEFEKLRTRVSDARSKIDTLLEGTSPDEVLPEMDLSRVSSQLESIRLALVEMGTHVAVSNYVPGAGTGTGTGSAPQITITRERLMAFLDALGLPDRVTQIQPPSQKPEPVPQSQYDYQQTVWNALKSDVEVLKQRSSLPEAPSSTKLTEDEVQDSRTRMDRVLVNLLKLETASQIAALRFPESSQSTMTAACIPSWVATDSELSNVMAQLRQEMCQLSSTSATISSGPTIEQVHQVVFQETQGIREDLDRKIADALTQPRALIPEQVQKLEESTTGRVMKILSESALPPLTLPPDPSDSSELASGLDRSKAPGQYRQGSAMFFSSEFDGNQKAMDHFSAAAKLDPRNPTYRYFLALTLRRSGQTVEAARQARIGASLEARRDR